MGSPSRNVQYHPPRLSEDRLNLAQPHSPSLPTHCSGKSGMRPRHVRQQERRIAGCDQRDRRPVHLERVHLIDRVHVVVAEHEPLDSGRLTPPFLVVRQEAAVDAHVAQADDRLRGADQLVPRVHHDLVHLVRHLKRPVEGDYRRHVAQVQVRPEPGRCIRSFVQTRAAVPSTPDQGLRLPLVHPPMDRWHQRLLQFIDVQPVQPFRNCIGRGHGLLLRSD